jgi:hypothetical protein
MTNLRAVPRDAAEIAWKKTTPRPETTIPRFASRSTEDWEKEGRLPMREREEQEGRERLTNSPCISGTKVAGGEPISVSISYKERSKG